MSCISVNLICHGRKPMLEDANPNRISKSGSEISRFRFKLESISCSSISSIVRLFCLTFFAINFVVASKLLGPSLAAAMLRIVVSLKIETIVIDRKI